MRERVVKKGAIAEDVADHGTAGGEIACPPAAVALGRIPDAVLHAEVRGVSGGLPDAVKQRIGGCEGAHILHRVGDAFEADGAKGGAGRATNKAEPRVAEAALGAAG